jgi:hypothetical protein
MKVKCFLLGLTMLLTMTAFTGNATTVDHGNNKAAVTENVARMTKAQKEARIAEIRARVHEIVKMDKSDLSKSERKDLRKEARQLSKEARHMGYYDVSIVLISACALSFFVIMVSVA